MAGECNLLLPQLQCQLHLEVRSRECLTRRLARPATCNSPQTKQSHGGNAEGSRIGPRNRCTTGMTLLAHVTLNLPKSNCRGLVQKYAAVRE